MAAQQQGDVTLGACRAIARKVRQVIGAELRRSAVGETLQRTLWFGALSYLIVEVFTVAPTHNQPTIAERRKMFHDFLRVTTEDFEATLDELEGGDVPP